MKVIERKGTTSVLILVLMEYERNFSHRNPFTGKWVLILVLMEYERNRLFRKSRRVWSSSLNPCSNGIRAELILKLVHSLTTMVLILVLMEYERNRRFNLGRYARICFNPCSNGIRAELLSLPAILQEPRF